MSITAQDLMGVMRDAGLEESFLHRVRSDKPLKDQGFDSAYCPVMQLAIKDAYDIEIPVEDCPSLMTLEELAAYLSRKKG